MRQRRWTPHPHRSAECVTSYNQPVIIRPYQPQDFDELWQIDQQCFAAGIAYSRRELAAFINHYRAFTLVAGDGPFPIAGFIVAESDPAGAGHILTIDVRPQAQRTRCGSALLQAAEQRLIKDGCKAVLLETAVDNGAAVDFYERRGSSGLETSPRYLLDMVQLLGWRTQHTKAPK